jgi:hypothetical protein
VLGAAMITSEPAITVVAEQEKELLFVHVKKEKSPAGYDYGFV